jgi:esterase/lipase superfamily enzyme
MGNMVVIRALEKLSPHSSTPHFPLGEIIHAAPDVDPDLFAQFVEKMKEKGANITLYASASDKVLWFSGWLRDRPRAGYVAGTLVPMSGVDTIDITSASTSLFGLNHDVYASNPVIVADMRGILQGTRPPDKRTREFTRVDTEQGAYWKYQSRVGPAR